MGAAGGRGLGGGLARKLVAGMDPGGGGGQVYTEEKGEEEEEEEESD